jgi:hypothetical protein
MLTNAIAAALLGAGRIIEFEIHARLQSKDYGIISIWTLKDRCGKLTM